MTNEEAKAYFMDSNKRIISIAKDENRYNYETQQIEDVFMRRDFEAKELAIQALEQEPKTGHWIWQTEDIYRCSECGNDIRVKEVMNIPQYVRCPICEAKMVEPQESEEKE